jgi:hypothetical protein
MANPLPRNGSLATEGGRLSFDISQSGRDETAMTRAGGAQAQSTSQGFLGQVDSSGQFGGPPAGAAQPLTIEQRRALLMQDRGVTSELTAPVFGTSVTGGRGAMDRALTRDPTMGAAAPLGGDPVGSKVELGANQAADALGPAPKIDQGLADRQLGNFDEALGMSRDVIDRLLNDPGTAERLGSATLRSQLALARSAAGGPGAVAGALRNAQAQAPELQAQATQSAVAENLSRTTAAGNVASNFANAALGARGQDVGIAAKNVEASTALMSEISRLTGTQLQLDQQNQEFLGQMARDWAAIEFDWGKLSVDQQVAEWDKWVNIYGIDKNFAAQVKAIAAGENIGPADWFNGIVGVIGAGAGIGAAAAGGK